MGVKTSKFANIWLQIKQIGNFHPLKVMGCGSERQFQVGEHLYYIT